MNSCILCGKEAVSSKDNACIHCIADLSQIDAQTLPEWLVKANAQKSIDYLREILRE